MFQKFRSLQKFIQPKTRLSATLGRRNGAPSARYDTFFPLRPLRPRIRHSGESRNPGAVRGMLCRRYSGSFGCGDAALRLGVDSINSVWRKSRWPPVLRTCPTTILQTFLSSRTAVPNRLRRGLTGRLRPVVCSSW
jgi:hypothetical protein